MFACRSCDYTENATSDCVYRNALQEQIKESAGTVDDVAQDPTVRDDSDLPSASDSFMSDSFYYGGEYEKMPETCTYCGKEIVCPSCGEPTDGGLLLEVVDPGDGLNEAQKEKLVDAERRERTLSNVG